MPLEGICEVESVHFQTEHEAEDLLRPLRQTRLGLGTRSAPSTEASSESGGRRRVISGRGEGVPRPGDVSGSEYNYGHMLPGRKTRCCFVREGMAT